MTDPSRTFITGFTAFGRFGENPSAMLAASCSGSRPHRLIEVAYAAVDAFIESIDPAAFDRLVMLGVAGTSVTLRVERIARNVIGPTPDVRNDIPVQPLIDPAGPQCLHANLWPAAALLPSGSIFSDDAGDYLCNYLAYRAMRTFGQTKRVGFIHVPPIEAMDLKSQQQCVRALLAAIENPTDSSPCRAN